MAGFGIGLAGAQKSASYPASAAVDLHTDRALAFDVSGLVKHSDYILTGRFGQIEQQMTLSSRPHYVEGDVYTFSIEESLHGEVEKDESDEVEAVTAAKGARTDERTEGTEEAILVVIPHYADVSNNSKGGNKQTRFMEPHYFQPDSGLHYILFLKYNPAMDIYTPAAAPFALEISPDHTVWLKYEENDSGRGEADFDWKRLDQLTGQPLDKVLLSLEREVARQKTK